MSSQHSNINIHQRVQTPQKTQDPFTPPDMKHLYHNTGPQMKNTQASVHHTQCISMTPPHMTQMYHTTQILLQELSVKHYKSQS